MLSRRSRIQVKPNVGKISKLGSKPSEKDSESTPSTHQPPETSPENNQTATFHEPSSGADHTDHTAPETSSSTGEVLAHTDHTAAGTPSSTDVASVVNVPVPCASLQIARPQEECGSTSVDRIVTEKRAESSAPKAYERFTYDDCKRNLRRLRRKFTGKEKLDPKTMRMVDLVYWNPKKEKGMTHHRVDNESVIGEEMSARSKEPATVNKVVAPQVKIGADGRLVIDEESLVVAETTNESIWETMDEGRVPRKINSLSFRNRLRRKGITWTEKETELFYEILRCTGPDFGLMHEFFPSRSRIELKAKFNREERTNWAKLKEVLSKPALLDDDLYGRSAGMQKEIDEEALAKQMKKEKSRDIKIVSKKGRRSKKDTLVGEDERNESSDTVGASSGTTCEVEDGTSTSSGLPRKDQPVDVLPTSQLETEIVGQKTVRKPKKLSARAQELLDKVVELSKPTVVQQSEVRENQEAQEKLDGYDDAVCDSNNDEDDSARCSSSELICNDTEQTTTNTKAVDEMSIVQSPLRNQHDMQETLVEDTIQCSRRIKSARHHVSTSHNSSQKQHPKHHETVVEDSDENVVSGVDEDVTTTTKGSTSPVRTNIRQKPAIAISPPVLVRPRVKRKLVLETKRTMRSQSTSRRETEQLCETSKSSELESATAKISDDVVSSRHGSGMLTRSSRLRKPPVVNAEIPEKRVCWKSGRIKAT